MGTILIVEDDHQTANLLKNIIDTLGVSTAHAYDADGCVDLLQQFTPVLFLIDLRLPGMSGWDLISWLRDNDTTKDTPIIALTVEITSSDRQLAFDAGCDLFISKPFNVKVIREAITSYLSV